jgi:hypothetical protein
MPCSKFSLVESWAAPMIQLHPTELHAVIAYGFLPSGKCLCPEEQTRAAAVGEAAYLVSSAFKSFVTTEHNAGTSYLEALRCCFMSLRASEYINAVGFTHVVMTESAWQSKIGGKAPVDIPCTATASKSLETAYRKSSGTSSAITDNV